MTRVTNSKLLPQRMPALNSPKQNMHAPPKQNSHTVPLQLVCPNMHKARSFPRSPATNYWIFPHPLSREASSIHGVVRTDTHTELKLFQPPTSTPKKIRQDQTLPYPQVSMVTRRVTSAEIQKQSKQGPKSVAFLGLLCTCIHPGR